MIPILVQTSNTDCQHFKLVVVAQTKCPVSAETDVLIVITVGKSVKIFTVMTEYMTKSLTTLLSAPVCSTNYG